MATSYDFSKDAVVAPATAQANINALSAGLPGQLLTQATSNGVALDGQKTAYQAFTPNASQLGVPEVPGGAPVTAPPVAATPAPVTPAAPTTNYLTSSGSLASDVARLRALGYSDPASIAGALNRANGTNYSADAISAAGTAPGANGAVTGTVLSQDEYQKKYGPQKVDEAAIRKQKMEEQQAQIDAINAVYDNMVSAQNVTNEGNLGSTRAINARSGTLGSDFGNSNLGKQKMENDKALNAINAERGLRVQAIYSTINKSIEDEIKAKKDEALGNANAYKDYLAKAQTDSREAVKGLGASGLSYDELKVQKPEVLDSLLKNTGYDEFTLAQIMNSNKKAAERIEYTYKTVGDKIIGYGLNPKTNQIETIEKTIPGLTDNLADYTPQTLADGTLILTPKQIDPSKPLSEQVLMYGTEGQFAKDPATDPAYKFVPATKYQAAGYFNEKTGDFKPVAGARPTGSGTGTGTGSTSTAAYAKQLQQLSSTKGADGFINTDKYKEIRSGLKSTERTAFDANFAYLLNPNDASASAFVKKPTTTAANKYTNKNIPADVRDDLSADMADPNNDLADIIAAYPDVDDAYIRSLRKAVIGE